jgi:hypothetical protein
MIDGQKARPAERLPLQAFRHSRKALSSNPARIEPASTTSLILVSHDNGSNQTMKPTNEMFDVRCAMFDLATAPVWLICLS